MKKSSAISPKTTEHLEDRVSKLEREKAELELQLKWYKEQLSLQQRQKFGKSSEKTDPDQLELPLFNEAEQEQHPSEEEPTVESITYERKKKRKVRKDLTENLPSKTIEHTLPVEDQVCSCCNGKLHTMKQQVKEELEIIPAEVKVIRYVTYLYSCRDCEKNGTGNPIVKAPVPERAFPGSLASPSMVSYIMDQKFVQGTPLYRQEQAFNRLGVPLSRQTLSNWILEGSEQWLEPIYDRMVETLTLLDVLHADETTVQVLKEDGKEASSTSYMWLYRSGMSSVPIVIYDYQPGRASKYPIRFLEGFKGYLHVDGYGGYHGLKPKVELVGCWAHARRKFVDAVKSLPDDGSTTKSSAQEGLDFINQLYRIEKHIQEERLSPEKVYDVRQKRSKPVLEAYSAWLQTMRAKTLPKTLLGKAIVYSINQMDHLRNFLKDGRLDIDNNRAERSIKPFVIGRKNWLFSNTPRGAKSSSVIYSIIETAKENRLKPQAYLDYLFEHLPNSKQSEMDQFLPWSESLPEEIRIK
ncbi:IS66 family transposase [Salisediminibacterium beveridgei]|uniref:Mobile element protein n=1 Tax=Salisediminibacterium beveridgei TaxID=632773 RepID=A0A1D7QST2_9BACI|nr:IS66 family transposase [Salisediminibacterium beveridgei]AOM82059.1 Mobile element protein [Salisediminibacterium beveridgei]AOM82901.1 Mobile element protein [Salisediminibacterium beveridgei]AOM83798.1 Mobile element protein [Salisediminibacterium beveridgei]AOM83896.1 Mobile element protein [Salisediminibacterium beveridgei]AOM84420.1 Mobile element protein [Salisediminibacterium beveridgei]